MARRTTPGAVPAGTKPKAAKAAEEVTVDLADLTWDDMDQIELIKGSPIGTEMAAGNVSMATVRALIVWQRRKTNPQFELKGSDRVREIKVEVRGTAKRPTRRGAA